LKKLDFSQKQKPNILYINDLYSCNVFFNIQLQTFLKAIENVPFMHRRIIQISQASFCCLKNNHYLCTAIRA